jgi:hypothetical protein
MGRGRYSHLIIASAGATEVRLDQILLDGFDHDQTRKLLAAALAARGSCAIRNCENDAELDEFCAATWPEQWAALEAETAVAEKFPNLRKQIEAFVLDRAKEALASSRIMNSSWREMLETTSNHFASDMNELDASATINQAKCSLLDQSTMPLHGRPHRKVGVRRRRHSDFGYGEVGFGGPGAE